MLAGEERGQALLAQRSGLDRAGVLLQERQRDRALELVEDPDRAGPEALQLGAQLVAQRHARLHEILPAAAQRPQRLGLVAVGLKYPEAMVIGARELAQHERVEPVRLAARDAEPRPAPQRPG